jgi:hypothetical protein
VQIAERCPIHRMLVPQVQIQTTRNDSAAHRFSSSSEFP